MWYSHCTFGRFHHDGAKAWKIKLHPQDLSFSRMIHHILALQEINTAIFIGLLFLCNCMLKVACFLLHRGRNIEFDIISQIITKLKASRRSVPNMMSVKKSKIEIRKEIQCCGYNFLLKQDRLLIYESSTPV